MSATYNKVPNMPNIPPPPREREQNKCDKCDNKNHEIDNLRRLLANISDRLSKLKS